MTKKYEEELNHLPQTYQWSLRAPIDKLCSFIEASRLLPLFAVGSGGSLTAAYMATLLHQRVGMMAKAVTPLEFTNLRNFMPNTSVLILSAGGRNIDILSAFRLAAVSEPRQLMTLCMRTNSPIADLSNKFQYTQILDFDLPCGKDGFLATNSLLAFFTILTRAYNEINSEKDPILPVSLFSNVESYKQVVLPTQPLFEKNTWIILYGGWGLPAAMDAESKFTEAALKNVQVADYRNFAHGRHHWLAKRGLETGIVALVTPDERELAAKTLDLLPNHIPILQLETNESGPNGAIELLVKVLYLVQWTGNAQQIDPGKPGVPDFGRRIYHLRNPLYKVNIQKDSISPTEKIAILRKSKYVSLADMKTGELQCWRVAYREFTKQVKETSFGAVVFDYDGTLCAPSKRYEELSQEVGKELTRLLRAGICIGIATGRGKSVRLALQQIIPEEYWGQVLVGYYNGADTAILSDIERPDKVSPMDAALKQVKEALEMHWQFNQVAKYEYRPKQVSIFPLKVTLWEVTRSILLDIIHKAGIEGIQVLESSHSMDVIAPGVSKRNLVDACERTIKYSGRSNNVLCIGDKGEWPGNDYSLLSTPYSLSVDTVSTDPASCWNLSQPGYRGIQATLDYLRLMIISDGALRLQLNT